MPSVTVKLLYTPRPSDNAVEVPEIDCRECVVKLHETGNVGFYSSGAYVSLGRTTPAEALALANALTLVAGCADTRWRGWHWEAREQNGQLLATTPVGEWYVNREDCERAVITLFGDHTKVVAVGPSRSRPSWADPRIHAGSMRPGDYPLPADPDDGGTPDCGGTCCSHVTGDADPDEYPVGSVEL